MSFSINNAKVKELRTSSYGEYDEQISVVDVTSTNLDSHYPSYGAGGTDYGSPVLVTPETRDHLIALRRKIEGSGIPLISAGDLDSEIRELRR